jgi:hypothetical protein
MVEGLLWRPGKGLHEVSQAPDEGKTVAMLVKKSLLSCSLCLPVYPSNNPGLLLGVAAQELRTFEFGVRVRIKAPARFEAQPSLVDIVPLEFVGELLCVRVA